MSLHVDTMGSGPDLVMLHGWGLHGGFFAPVTERFVARYRIHVVDLPGHGHSPASGATSLQDWVDAVVDVVPARAAWLGWSLGGMLALARASAEPDTVTRMVTVAATPRFTTADDWPHATTEENLERFSSGFDSDYRRAILNFLALQVHGDDDARDLLRALRPRLFERGNPDPAGLEAGLGLLRTLDLRETVRGMHTPLLALGGARDRLVPAKAVHALADSVADGRSGIFARAAHAPFLSEPARFVEVVEEFLGDG